MTEKKTKTTVYNSAEYLDSPEAVSAYMDEALATNDTSFIANAIVITSSWRCELFYYFLLILRRCVVFMVYGS